MSTASSIAQFATRSLKSAALPFTTLLFGLLLFSSVTQAAAERRVDEHKRFESGDNRVSLIELYTSEGCSSCPPADRYLTQIGDGNALWKNVVPVAFHVSYWDRLGWPDRFAQRAFDSRQRLLAKRANTGVYTPGVFRDGAEFRRWRNAPAPLIDRAFVAASERSPAAGNLKLMTENSKSWTLSYKPSVGQAAIGDTGQLHNVQEAYVALLGNNFESEVIRGENAGKKLHHDFVALKLVRVTLEPAGSGELKATFTLDTNLDNTWDTTLDTQNDSRLVEQDRVQPAIAAWVVDQAGFPIQALGGPL